MPPTAAKATQRNCSLGRRRVQPGGVNPLQVHSSIVPGGRGACSSRLE